jgi:hypothetical protein
MKAILTTIATAILSLPCIAQTTYYTPVLVDTLNPTTNNMHYMGYKPQALNGKLFFCADSGTTNIKTSLYVTDGMPGGTKLLKDGDNSWGVQLWQTATLNNKLLFTTLTRPYEQMLWESDGAPASTQSLLDIGTGNDLVSFITTIGNKTFFIANDVVHGEEPWVTDGTVTGTRMLKDTDPNAGWGPIWEAACAMDGRYYLFATNGITAEVEMWASDGTTGGTIKLQDFVGAALPFGHKPMVVNGAIYFALENAGNLELWATSGAIGDARKVGTLANDDCTGYYAELNGLLYFTQYDGNNTILWMTDGVQLTALKQGPKPYYSSMNDVIAFNGFIYFNHDDGIVGNEIWRTNGITTNMYKDVWPGVKSGGGSGFTIAGDMLYFFSDRPTGAQLFCTDGVGPNINSVFPIGMTPGWGADDAVYIGGFMTAMNDTIYCKGRYDNNGWGLYKVRPVVVNSVKDIEHENPVQLYPNPTTGDCVVVLKKGVIKEVEVCDALGRRVYKQAGNHVNSMQLSLPATLSNGIYTLRIATQDGIVKQRLQLNR